MRLARRCSYSCASESSAGHLALGVSKLGPASMSTGELPQLFMNAVGYIQVCLEGWSGLQKPPNIRELGCDEDGLQGPSVGARVVVGEGGV